MIAYYRCHVGHQWSPQSLVAAQTDTAEAKLWTAVSALEELAALQGHLAAVNGLDAGHSDREPGAHSQDGGARRAAELAQLIKELLTRSLG